MQAPKAFNLGINIFVSGFVRKLLYCPDLSEKTVGAVSPDSDSWEFPARQLDDGIVAGW
jgi:hypothetical protein